MALREAFRDCGKKRRPMNAVSNLTVTELVELGLGCLDDSDLNIDASIDIYGSKRNERRDRSYYERSCLVCI